MKEFALFICFFIFSFGTIEANYVPIDTFPSNMNENILDVRKPNITGYIPDYIVSQKKKFPRTIWRKSKKKLGLTYTPDNPESLPNVKIITPDIISWDEAEFNNPSINLWLIIPADYSHLGVINMIESGTKDSIKVIRPYYPNTSKPYQLIHPSKVEDSENETIVDGFEKYNSSYWTYAGLTVGGYNTYNSNYDLYGSKGIKMGEESNNNSIVNCMFKQWVGNMAAIMIYNSSYNIIQDCLFKDPYTVGPDIGGILMFATKDRESRNNIIVGNEFYNVSDGIGMTYGTGQGDLQKIGELPATVIANNDIYYDETHPAWMLVRGNWVWIEETICGENAIDIKVGTDSDDPDDKIIVAYNRMWGYRPTDQSCGGSGSGGEAIVIHLNAKNILVYGNIVYDSITGIVVEQGKVINGVQTNTRNIAIVNNLFYGMVKVPELDSLDVYSTSGGVAIKTISDSSQVYFNTIHSCEEALIIKLKWTYRFQCNTIVNAKVSCKYPQDNDSWSGLNSWFNYPSLNPDEDEIYAHGSDQYIYIYSEEVDDANLVDYSFYIKKYTGKILITFPNVVASMDGGPQLPLLNDCNCYIEPCEASWLGVKLKK